MNEMPRFDQVHPEQAVIEIDEEDDCCCCHQLGPDIEAVLCSNQEGPALCTKVYFQVK